MTKESKPSPTDRNLNHERMLEEALSRPGIPEVIKICNEWNKQNNVLNHYRDITRGVEHTTSETSVHSTEVHS